MREGLMSSKGSDRHFKAPWISLEYINTCDVLRFLSKRQEAGLTFNAPLVTRTLALHSSVSRFVAPRYAAIAPASILWPARAAYRCPHGANPPPGCPNVGPYIPRLSAPAPSLWRKHSPRKSGIETASENAARSALPARLGVHLL